MFRAKNRAGPVIITKEFEAKLSQFYGMDIYLSTLAMDTWLCSNLKEVDNVVMCFEPVNRRLP